MSMTGENANLQEPIRLDLDNLPEDVEFLHRMILDLLSTLEDRQSTIEKLKHQIQQLQRHRFGSKSERFEALEEQLLLFEKLQQLQEEALEEPLVETAEDEAVEVSPKRNGKKKEKGHGRKPFPEHLPRVRVEFPLTQEQLDELGCSIEDFKKIGEEITCQLEYVPASFYVKELVRFKYAYANGQEGIVLGDLPPQPIEKGIPGPGLLAQVLTSKYCDHLPLNRQEGIFKRHGVDISRKTTCGWVAKAAELLAVLVSLMKKELIASRKIHTDDTAVPVLDENLKKTRKGRLWVYCNEDHIVYDYTPDRSREGPLEFLRNYSGYLQADAYAGYNETYKSGDVVEVGCWTHARRKFVESKDTDPLRATAALVFIGRLYRIEARVKDADDDARLAVRQAESVPILEEFKAWIVKEYDRILPKSPIGNAMTYALNQWEALLRYTQDGSLSIDNNRAERAMRIPVLGRNNYLFFGSDNGGKSAAIIYSLVATCKLHGVDPFAYFRDVLERLPAHPIQQLHELLPINWNAANQSAAD